MHDNIPYMFDDWADLFSHHLLLKRSMVRMNGTKEPHGICSRLCVREKASNERTFASQKLDHFKGKTKTWISAFGQVGMV